MKITEQNFSVCHKKCTLDIYSLLCCYWTFITDFSPIIFVNRVTNNLKHDAFAVKAFDEHIIKHLENERQIKVSKVLKISDGAGNQFKYNKSFRILSKSPTFTNNGYFFRSNHGKNKCKVEVVVAKAMASTSVKSM